MKRMLLATILAATGSALLAQQAGVGTMVTVSGAAPVTVPGVMSGATTNASKPDVARMNAVVVELNTIGNALRERGAKLLLEDPELKVVIEKKNAAQQVVAELEKQRQAMVEAKLKADPQFGPLVVRYRELQQLWQTMYPSSAAGPRDNPMGSGYQKKPAADGPAHKIVPVPAPVPAGEVPAEQSKTK